MPAEPQEVAFEPSAPCWRTIWNVRSLPHVVGWDAPRRRPAMHVANLQLEGLMMALAFINQTLVRKGILSVDEVDLALRKAEASFTSEERLFEDMTPTNRDAVCFPQSASARQPRPIGRLGPAVFGVGEERGTDQRILQRPEIKMAKRAASSSPRRPAGPSSQTGLGVACEGRPQTPPEAEEQTTDNERRWTCATLRLPFESLPAGSTLRAKKSGRSISLLSLPRRS